MGTESADLVRSIYEAFGRGDVPGVLGAMAEDIEWHEAEGMPYGGVHHGPNGVAQGVFGPVLQDIPDFTVTPEEFIAAGDQVAVIARYRGTGAASFTSPSSTTGNAPLSTASIAGSMKCVSRSKHRSISDALKPSGSIDGVRSAASSPLIIAPMW